MFKILITIIALAANFCRAGETNPPPFSYVFERGSYSNTPSNYTTFNLIVPAPAAGVEITAVFFLKRDGKNLGTFSLLPDTKSQANKMRFHVNCLVSEFIEDSRITIFVQHTNNAWIDGSYHFPLKAAHKREVHAK